jgi:hypothetical protein
MSFLYFSFAVFNTLSSRIMIRSIVCFCLPMHSGMCLSESTRGSKTDAFVELSQLYLSIAK